MAMEAAQDAWANVESCTLTEGELDAEFDDGWGATNGKPFTIWTKNNVYFPIRYDGREWCGFVSRNPDGKPTEHVGGG